MSKHTKGPWYDIVEGGVCACGRDDNQGFAIAKCFGPRAKENAKLIAAAPDLLAACEMMLTVYGLAQEAPHAVDVMRAAVAKAKGET